MELLRCETCGATYGPNFDGLYCTRDGCNGKVKAVNPATYRAKKTKECPKCHRAFNGSITKCPMCKQVLLPIKEG